MISLTPAQSAICDILGNAQVPLTEEQLFSLLPKGVNITFLEDVALLINDKIVFKINLATTEGVIEVLCLTKLVKTLNQ